MKIHLRSATRTFLGSILFAAATLSVTMAARADFYVSVSAPPPPIPVYDEQPIIPGDGYIWTPGYWAWDSYDYYWVPGAWVPAPFVGALWTPGYWGWQEGLYTWRSGYWGHHVGFYGGIDYGCGYTGYGYHGGYWNRGAFVYNRAVNNVNVSYIRNAYSAPVARGAGTARVSYYGGVSGAGGAGGMGARMGAQDRKLPQDLRSSQMPARPHDIQAAVGATPQQPQRSFVDASRERFQPSRAYQPITRQAPTSLQAQGGIPTLARLQPALRSQVAVHEQNLGYHSMQGPSQGAVRTPAPQARGAAPEWQR